MDTTPPQPLPPFLADLCAAVTEVVEADVAHHQREGRLRRCVRAADAYIRLRNLETVNAGVTNAYNAARQDLTDHDDVPPLDGRPRRRPPDDAGAGRRRRLGLAGGHEGRRAGPDGVARGGGWRPMRGR